MISFADQFGELLKPPSVAYRLSEPKGYPSPLPCVLTPPEALTPGLVWDWRIVDFGHGLMDDLYNWVAVPEGGDRRLVSITVTGTAYSTNHADGPYWIGADFHNPLAAMCNHKDTHSTERLPESTAKEAPAGINTVAGFDHRPGAWK